MNISLPEALKSFVKERTKKANYSNPSDYVRSFTKLLRASGSEIFMVLVLMILD